MSESAKTAPSNWGKTLIGPEHEKADVINRVFGKALGKSDWVARSGMPSNFYFNLDKIYSNPDMDKKDIKEVHAEIIDQMEIGIRKIGASCVGFIMPNQGPAGVIQLRGIFAERLSIPTVVVRINERLLRNQIWFEQKSDVLNPPISPKSKVLLFCDAATSGTSIYRAALIVKKFGAKCSDALVLFNRLQGANDRLTIKHMILTSFIDRKFFEHQGALKDDDFKHDGKGTRLEFESVSATV